MSQDYNDMIRLLVDAIAPLMEGKPSQIVGAALADLTAIWIASHVVAGDPKATEKHRDMLFKYQLATIKQLIPINDRLGATAINEVSTVAH